MLQGHELLEFPIGHFVKYHNTLCLSPQILHCFQFLLGLTLVPREKKTMPLKYVAGEGTKCDMVFSKWPKAESETPKNCMEGSHRQKILTTSADAGKRSWIFCRSKMCFVRQEKKVSMARFSTQTWNVVEKYLFPVHISTVWLFDHNCFQILVKRSGVIFFIIYLF